jgi:NH3-dependent NAD+ synthetase
MRAPWGRAANRLTGGGIRHGTGNEDEDRTLRFFQKGGDGEVDTNPISMFSKGEVFQLARALGCPESILKAKPTPDLWGVGEVHNDEEEIASYLRLSGTEYPMYSYINDEGEYTCIGLVERFQRFLDIVGYGFFDDSLSARHVDIYIDRAIVSPLFRGIDQTTVVKLLTSMRRVERMTRHKQNPNIPALGSRAIVGLVGIDGLTALL